MNIIVLAGGYSPERDVSLLSGGQAVKALRRKGHTVLLLDAYENLQLCSDFTALYSKYARDDYVYAIPEAEPDLAALKTAMGNGGDLLGTNVLAACKLADVVFIALHGAVGENGQLQAALNLFDVRFTGSDFAGCLLSMDKAIAVELMNARGVQTPQSEVLALGCYNLSELYGLLSKKLPFVLKPYNGGSSLGVTIVKTPADIKLAVDCAQKYEDRVLIENYIAGREFTVGVLDGTPLPVIEICPKTGFFDYINKYQDGMTDEICPADIGGDLARQLQALAVKAHAALRLGDYSRADFIVDDRGEIYCLEVNSLPGLTPASLVPKAAAVHGLSYDDLCETIVQLALKR